MKRVENDTTETEDCVFLKRRLWVLFMLVEDLWSIKNGVGKNIKSKQCPLTSSHMSRLSRRRIPGICSKEVFNKENGFLMMRRVKKNAAKNLWMRGNLSEIAIYKREIMLSHLKWFSADESIWPFEAFPIYINGPKFRLTFLFFAFYVRNVPEKK